MPPPRSRALEFSRTTSPLTGLSGVRGPVPTADLRSFYWLHFNVSHVGRWLPVDAMRQPCRSERVTLSFSVRNVLACFARTLGSDGVEQVISRTDCGDGFRCNSSSTWQRAVGPVSDGLACMCQQCRFWRQEEAPPKVVRCPGLSPVPGTNSLGSPCWPPVFGCGFGIWPWC